MRLFQEFQELSVEVHKVNIHPQLQNPSDFYAPLFLNGNICFI